MIREASELFERMGVAIDPLALVDNLKTSEKQLLEIAKALLHNAKLLILDEPTTSLNNDEIAHLFEIIKRLKDQEQHLFLFPIRCRRSLNFLIAIQYFEMESLLELA